MEARYSIWGTANKLKLEALDQAKKSIFWDVYRKADRMLFEIVKEGLEICDDGRKRDDQVANVISFLGERGRGKTSAMMSFYAYLNELQKRDANWWSEFQEIQDRKIRFVELPCIDAAALAQNEFVIEVILAKMWDKFDDFMKEKPHKSQDAHFEYLVRSVRTEFINVQKSYTILRKKELNKVNEEDISAASALHELAVSMNFKKSFELLIEDYIRVLNYKKYNEWREEETGYLVLAIDDIDMAGDEAQSILEQIRRFLSVPQIIILLTADIERLKNVCEAFYQKVYPKGRNLHKFVNDYLEKVLPTNNRVYMPELSENQKRIPIEKNESKNKKMKLKKTYEKEMILELMAKKCGVYFDGIRRERHFLQNDSLRSLVNYFEHIASIEDDEYILWLKKDLQERIVERIENEEQKEFVKSLLMKDYEDVSNLVINYIKRNLKDSMALKLTDKSMGQVLYACSLLEDEDAGNMNFVNSILLLYTIMLKQASDDLKRKIIGNSVWGEWEYGALTATDQVTDFISGFENRAELELEITEDVEKCIESGNLIKAVEILLDRHETVIRGWLYVMLFVNIKVSENFAFEAKKLKHIKLREELSPSHQGRFRNLTMITLQPKVKATRSFFGFLYKNEIVYLDILKQLLRSMVTELCKMISKGTGKELRDETVEDIVKKYMRYINEMEWGREKIDRDVVQSVEIIYSIGKEIGREKLTSTSQTDKLYEKMISLYQIIRDAFYERDKYYEKEIGIKTMFGRNFDSKIQTKIFLEPNLFSTDVKKAFIKWFTKLFRGVISVDSPN